MDGHRVSPWTTREVLSPAGCEQGILWPWLALAAILRMTNRFSGLDMIGRVPEELRMVVRDIVQEAGIKIIPGSVQASWPL